MCGSRYDSWYRGGTALWLCVATVPASVRTAAVRQLFGCAKTFTTELDLLQFYQCSAKIFRVQKQHRFAMSTGFGLAVAKNPGTACQ